MVIRALSGGLRPTTLEADSLVVYADDGVTPLALVVRHAGDAHYVATCADPRFNEILRNMGVNAVAVVSEPPVTIGSVATRPGVVRL